MRDQDMWPVQWVSEWVNVPRVQLFYPRKRQKKKNKTKLYDDDCYEYQPINTRESTETAKSQKKKHIELKKTDKQCSYMSLNAEIGAEDTLEKCRNKHKQQQQKTRTTTKCLVVWKLWWRIEKKSRTKMLAGNRLCASHTVEHMHRHDDRLTKTMIFYCLN